MAFVATEAEAATVVTITARKPDVFKNLAQWAISNPSAANQIVALTIRYSGGHASITVVHGAT